MVIIAGTVYVSVRHWSNKIGCRIQWYWLGSIYAHVSVRHWDKKIGCLIEWYWLGSLLTEGGGHQIRYSIIGEGLRLPEVGGTVNYSLKVGNNVLGNGVMVKQLEAATSGPIVPDL